MVSYRQPGLNLRLHSTINWSSVFVSDANRQAVTRLCQNPHLDENVFVCLYGPSGSGKSLLASLWSQTWQAWHGYHEQWQELLTILPLGGGCFAIDDFILSETSEEKLWHLYMRMQEIDARMLIVTETPPGQWPRLDLPDLRTRLIASPHLELSLPDDKQLEAFLVQSVLSYGFNLQEESQQKYNTVWRYCLNRTPRSYAAILALANLIHEAALEKHSDLSIPIARLALSRLCEDTKGLAAPDPFLI